MSMHRAAVRWQRDGHDFTYDTYSRAHELSFKQGRIVVAGSAAPEFRGDAARVDPEEAYVSALAACHMLSFLALCARRRIGVELYVDEAEGILEKDERGRMWIPHVRLKPQVRFIPGQEPTQEILAQLHHRAHAECFIANSVRTEVTVSVSEG